VPDSTEVNPDKDFNAWADWRHAAEPNDIALSDILSSGDAAALNKWLSLYIIKKDSESYPSTSLNLLLCG